MSPLSPDAAAENWLLASLSRAELERVAEHLETTALDRDVTIQAPNQPAGLLHFPMSGVISVVSETAEGQAVEVATIGREGVAGYSAVLGSPTSPLRSMCQIAGTVLVGEVEPLIGNDGTTELREAILRYAHTALVQAAVTAACNRLHSLEQRAARWLLTVADRTDDTGFNLTHEYFAVMLGAQRPSVSLVAKMLQQGGLITYRRGRIEIVDRDGLTDAACECYGTIAEHYEEAMGIPLRR